MRQADSYGRGFQPIEHEEASRSFEPRQSSPSGESQSSAAGSSNHHPRRSSVLSAQSNGVPATERGSEQRTILARDLALLSIENDQPRTPSISVSGSAAETGTESTQGWTPASSRASSSISWGGVNARLDALVFSQAGSAAPPGRRPGSGRLHTDSQGSDVARSETASTQSRRRRSSSRLAEPRHEVESEELPSEPFHAPAFQAAFGDAKDLVSMIRDGLSTSDLSGDPESTLARLVRESTRLANFECQNTRTVGLVGDSGVGKSLP